MADQWNLERKIRHLVQFGLTPLEAKVYTSLLQTGTASAYRVAKNARIHRVEAYRALGRLKRLGLVEEFMGRPVLFQPVPPGRGVQLLIEEVATKLRELNMAKQETVRWLRSISATRLETEGRASFRLIEGTKNLHEIARQMWGNAKEEVLFTRDQAQMRITMKEELADFRQKLTIEAIRLRRVTEIRGENIQDIVNIAGFLELRHLSPMNLHMDIIDSSEALLGAVSKEEEETFCIWTNGPSYVMVLRELFEHLWEESFPGGLRIMEIRSGDLLLSEEYESLKRDLRNVLLDQTKDALDKFLDKGMEFRKRLGIETS